VGPQKAPKVAPDLEEAIEEEDDAEVLLDEPGDAVDDEDVDISKDKYIKQPKAPKESAPKKASTKKRKKASAGKENNDDVSEEEIKPKPARGGKGSGSRAKSKF
jgi:replication factor C subunit 1